MKDGTPYFMWSIEEVRPLIAKDHEPISKVDYYVRRVQDALKQAQELDKIGQDKIACMLKDCAYDDVPKDIREEVKAKIEQTQAA